MHLNSLIKGTMIRQCENVDISIVRRRLRYLAIQCGKYTRIMKDRNGIHKEVAALNDKNK